MCTKESDITQHKQDKPQKESLTDLSYAYILQQVYVTLLIALKAPLELVKSLFYFANMFWAGLQWLIDAVSGPDPKSVINAGILGTRKKCAWVDSISLDESTRISRGLGVTINDFFITCLAGSLSRYIQRSARTNEQSRRLLQHDLYARIGVPVNIREIPTVVDPFAPNEFGFFICSVPIHPEHPMNRVKSVKREMDRVKRSAQPHFSYFVTWFAQYLPPWIVTSLFSFFATLCKLNVR